MLLSGTASPQREHAAATSHHKLARVALLATSAAALSMQSSPAFSRNINPIADAMASQGFDRCEFLLELGCGPGEHVVEFAKRWEEPFFQPTDCSRAAITSTDLRAKEAGLRATRICPARIVDVSQDKWPQVEGDPPYDGIYSINVIHIMAKSAIPSFFAGCGRNLRPGGLLGLYDTWTFDGAFIGPNNERFDASLRSQGYGGVAAIEECDDAASKAGLERIDVTYLPANNQFVTYRKVDDGDITPASLEFREAVMRADMEAEDGRVEPLPMGPSPDDYTGELPRYGDEGFADGVGGEDDL